MNVSQAAKQADTSPVSTAENRSTFSRFLVALDASEYADHALAQVADHLRRKVSTVDLASCAHGLVQKWRKQTGTRANIADVIAFFHLQGCKHFMTCH